MKYLKWAASCAVIAAACAENPAFAQNTGESEVEAIIVTAQKREQNLQDVPVVVTVVSGQALQDAGVRDVKDLQVLTPGLNVTSSTSSAQTSFRIRGVGTVGDNPGLESSVGTVIDGVYRARSSVAFGDLGELERIEVLKGPQGTLFGKNTSAGVINVITKEPEFVFHGNGELTAGNYNARGIAASVTGPIVDEKLAGRLYAAKRERDGFYDVRTAGGPRTETDDQNEDYYTVRGQLLWLPSDAVKVKLLADYTKRDEYCCVNVTTRVGPTAPIVNALAGGQGTATTADPFARVAYANRSTGQHITDKGVSAEVNWDINDDIALTSVTAWRGWKTENGGDIDFSGADIWYRPDNGTTYSEIKAFSQEVRLAGHTDRLDWLVGAFYAKEDLEVATATTFGTDYERYFSLLLSGGANPNFVSALTGLPAGTNFSAGAGPRDSYDHQSDGWALFTNNSWRVTDKLELTLGLRYTSEDKDVTSRYRNASPQAACTALLALAAAPLPPVGDPGYALAAARRSATVQGAICAPHADPAFDNIDTYQSRSENRWGGTFKAAYRFNPNVMVYGSYASSFKSGGFNLDRSRLGLTRIDQDTSFPAETVVSYEAGVKSNFLGNRVVLNATLFHQTFKDFQLNTYTGISWLVASIPEVVSRGVDLDASWRTPIEGLSVSTGVTYALTQFGEFTPPAGISPRLPNARMPYAPLWSASGSINYQTPIGAGLELRASLSGKYTSEYNTGSNIDPLKSQKELTLLNARLGIGAEDKRWGVEVWAQNLTDEDYYQVIVDQPLQSGTYAGFLGAPRTWGVTLRASF